MTRLSTSDDFVRALWRSGDDLYHLALLLSPDEQSADRALAAAVRRVAVAHATPDEPTLIAALVASLPSERGLAQLPVLVAKIRRPSWTRPPADSRELAPLLRALAALPRRSRLAIGLTLLRPFDPAQVATMLDGDELTVREQIRDALVGLARYAIPEDSAKLLGADEAPEACRPTRAALALGATTLQESGAARAHLALCPECRAAEQAWGQLIAAVETGLRAAMRPLRVPPALNAQLHAAAHPSQAQDQGLLDRPWKRIALVALPVLAVIAFLVLPRNAAPPAPTAGSPSGALASADDLQQLVRRAQQQLYRPAPNPAGPAGGTTWHGQYSLEWNFPDGSSADLTGNLWIDPAGDRHRVQIAHRSGGGPYEFELADGRDSAWYAATPNYAPAIYPFGANGTVNRAKLRATPQQQSAMLDARLRAGAWRTAPAYLEQAAHAELRTWGRQRDAEGRFLTLISFRGVSPLGFPSGAPEAAGAETTILLAIDADGHLREVRELAGATGAEQTARTTWRLDSEEWINVAEDADAVFDIQRAWNGIGGFADIGEVASTGLPLIETQHAVSLATLVQFFSAETFMPAAAPPGADSAIALDLAEGSSEPPPNGKMPIIYTGAGRSLAVRAIGLPQLSEPVGAGEPVTIGGQRAWLKPSLGQVYNATLIPTASSNRSPVAVFVSASGYTRDELLGVLRSLAPLTLQTYRAQAGLFYDSHAKDAAFEALVGALAPASAPPAGGARHFVEHAYKRQSRAADPLPDPYHHRPYGGWPDHWTQDNWARGDQANGTLETWSANRADDGTVIARQYRGLAIGWDYDAIASRVFQYPAGAIWQGQPLAEEQDTVLRMLSCGGYTLRPKAGGGVSVMLAEPNWHEKSCQNPSYSALWRVQTGRDAGDADQTPYLADVAEGSLTTVVDLGADGRPVRTEVWSDPPEQGGTLLESWERVAEEIVRASRVPADAVATAPPQATLRWEYPKDGVSPFVALRHIPITDAQSLVPSTLFILPNSQNVRLTDILGASMSSQQRFNHVSQGESVFERALNNGYAIQFTYTITQGDLIQDLRMFEGPATAFGAYLRDNARWKASVPISLDIGARKIAAWSVTSPANPSFGWLLFELDGTLVAIENPSTYTPTLLQELQPVAR